ncbi:OTU domain-containing protein 5-B-like isoform X2 [Adelges cooleyi]|uniref:OTU domain-containing protein 5-B-like isoform X2 n=1 Tax=Adelges cooleyi TaxID=133065 RepID=UPI00217FE396|nr:OTU domain-containing protein 5-B-like isoform X2 [Adelges cooleyi]
MRFFQIFQDSYRFVLVPYINIIIFYSHVLHTYQIILLSVVNAGGDIATLEDMTVLSKKKTQAISEEGEQSSSSHVHNLPLSNIQAHPQINTLEERINSPQRWPVDNIENVLSTNKQSKRRIHRSPHSTRNNNKGRERENRSTPNQGNCHCGTSDASGQCDINVCGYNSEDEYGEVSKNSNDIEWVEQDRLFEKKLKKRGLILKQMKEDGACLFRAVSDQLFGDQDMHDIVRKQCMDYVASNRDYYTQYVTEDFNTYIARKRLDCTHGNHVEIHAMSELYNRPIEVYCYGIEPINIFHGTNTSESSNPPIRLSYQRGSHYNSIVDPFKATIGVGLGLPNFSPGSADKKLLTDAVRQSEDYMLEQTMLEDKLRATDWEATNDTIEEQIARESYLQWLKDNEKRNKSDKEKSATSTATSASLVEAYQPRTSPPRFTVGPKTPPTSPAHHCSTSENASLMGLPPHVFGMSKWEDIGILTQVLATSQQEYLDSLKRQHDEHKEDGDKYNKIYDLDKPSTSQ